MATARLLGHTDDGTTNVGADTFRLAQFTALATGIVSEIKLYSSNSGNVKVAIYTDDSGEPGDLITANDSPQAVTADQWNTLSIGNTYLVKDAVYWLATNGDTNGAVTRYNTSAEELTRKKTDQTFSAFSFPDPAGSLDDGGDNSIAVAAWGILVIYPATIQSQEAVGSPTITVEGIQISPVTIPSAEAVGMPVLLYPQYIAPATIPSAEAVGVPSIGVIGYILPVTIPSQEAVGVPTILKYVWHVILDGNYITETPETNRAFVIGRDDYGNPVWGKAHDSDESALVGERLDFQQELAIPSSSHAAAAAAAILSKLRLTKQRGVIVIPPNCGQELFDVVELSDAGANQSAVKFRVVGIRFEYQPRQARYEYRLILGAP